MDNKISDADLERLFQINPLAAEQLRRIMAERHRAELQAEIEVLNGRLNGVGAEAAIADVVIGTA